MKKRAESVRKGSVLDVAASGIRSAGDVIMSGFLAQRLPGIFTSSKRLWFVLKKNFVLYSWVTGDSHLLAYVCQGMLAWTHTLRWRSRAWRWWACRYKGQEDTIATAQIPIPGHSLRPIKGKSGTLSFALEHTLKKITFEAEDEANCLKWVETLNCAARFELPEGMETPTPHMSPEPIAEEDEGVEGGNETIAWLARI
jgi:hypothetical protein